MLVELMDVPSLTVRRPILLVNATNLPTLFLGIFDSSKPMLSRNMKKGNKLVMVLLSKKRLATIMDDSSPY
jgi:hypothetical protein